MVSSSEALEKERREFLERKKHFYRFPQLYRVEPFRMAGNLYFIGNKDVGSYLLDTEEGLIVIDTGYPTTQGLLIHSIASLGFRVEDIRIIVHTHGHFDHIGCTSLLKELSRGTTYLGWRDGEMFARQPELSLKGWSGCDYFTLFTPDRLMGDGDIISLGTTKIRVVETPGHSDGTVSLFFDVREEGRTYRCGLMGGAGLNTLSDAFVSVYGRRQAREEFVASLNRLYQENVDINLGNHTSQNFTVEKRERMVRQGDGEENPFVDPGEWRRFLDERLASARW